MSHDLYSYLDEIPGPDISDPCYDHMRHFMKPEYLSAGHNTVNLPADPDPYEGKMPEGMNPGQGLSGASSGNAAASPGLLGRTINGKVGSALAGLF